MLQLSSLFGFLCITLRARDPRLRLSEKNHHVAATRLSCRVGKPAINIHAYGAWQKKTALSLFGCALLRITSGLQMHSEPMTVIGGKML